MLFFGRRECGTVPRLRRRVKPRIDPIAGSRLAEVPLSLEGRGGDREMCAEAGDSNVGQDETRSARALGLGFRPRLTAVVRAQLPERAWLWLASRQSEARY
jgi:hypothetical protein